MSYFLLLLLKGKKKNGRGGGRGRKRKRNGSGSNGFCQIICWLFYACFFTLDILGRARLTFPKHTVSFRYIDFGLHFSWWTITKMIFLQSISDWINHLSYTAMYKNTERIVHWLIEILSFTFPALDFCLAVHNADLFCHDSWLLLKINTLYVKCRQFFQCLIYLHLIKKKSLSVPLHQKRPRAHRPITSWYLPGREMHKCLRV